KVAAVTWSDIDALHRRIIKSGSPVAANRAIAVVSRLFALAVRWRMRPDNPAACSARAPSLHNGTRTRGRAAGQARDGGRGTAASVPKGLRGRTFDAKNVAAA